MIKFLESLPKEADLAKASEEVKTILKQIPQQADTKESMGANEGPDYSTIGAP